MQAEREDGNIEYKLKLSDCSDDRIQRLASQMRYRCNEGSSECIYNLGVEDDGTMTGITEEEYEMTMVCLKKAAVLNNYTLTKLSKYKVEEDKYVYELHVREKNDEKYIDVKVAIAGSVDCGKSTLLSVLTHGIADNGRGSARLSVFNFPHEIETGRTSSIGHQIVGYDQEGCVMNYQGRKQFTWPDIVKKSAKIISFFDLAGHEKYLKTTIFGLTSTQPDVCCIMIGANKGVLKMTIEHIFLCKTLNIPFCIVITKVDIVKDKENVLQNTIDSINSLLKRPGIRRIPVKIKTKDDIIRSALNIHSRSIVPIFQLSNVSMEGIDNLHYFLNIMPKKQVSIQSDLVEYHLDTSWTVTGVGTVVGGNLVSGKIGVGDKLWFGPINNKYIQVTVRSIHCKRVSVQQIETQSYICVSLRGISKSDVHKGHVLLSCKSQQILCKRLLVSVEVLRSHSTTIKPGYQPVLHAQNVRTCVTIEDITNKVSARGENDTNDKILRTGDHAELYLKLCFDKKFIKEGTDILLCEGRTKVVGHVMKLLDENE